MAFRDSVVTSGTTGGSPSDVAVTTPTIVAGDRLYCFICADSPSATIDDVPSGWTLIDSAQGASPDGHLYALYEKLVASGSEGASQTWSFDSSSVRWMAIMASWSGRHATNAPSFATETYNTSSNTSPISLSGSSGTAAAGDDIALFIGYDQTVSTATWTTASYSSSLTEQEDSNPIIWLSAALATRDSVGAGAFGTITATGTRSGSGNAGYLMYALAIPAAPGGGSDGDTATVEKYKLRIAA